MYASSELSRALVWLPNVLISGLRRINAKLGGINAVVKPRAVPILTDPREGAIVLGAHIISPGCNGPSFAALVSNVDSEAAKYVADCRVQTSRRDIIDDLEAMTISHITLYKSYQEAVEKKSPGPRRVIFYRSGVSEGQLKNILKFGASLHWSCALTP